MTNILMTLSLLIFFSITGCSTSKETTPEQRKAGIYYSYGTQHLVDKNYTEALSNLKKASEIDPEDSKIFNNLGMAYYFKKQTELAIKNIKKAIELDEKNLDAYVNLASIYTNQKKYALAEKYFTHVTDQLTYKHQYRVYYNLALIHNRRGNGVKALKLIENSISENPNYCPSFYLKGQINEQAKRYKTAFEAYKKSYLGVCVNNPSPHYRAARMLEKMGEYHRAQLKYTEIIDRFPTTQFAANSQDGLKRLSKISDRIMNQHENETMRAIEQEVKRKDAAPLINSPNF